MYDSVTESLDWKGAESVYCEGLSLLPALVNIRRVLRPRTTPSGQLNVSLGLRHRPVLVLVRCEQEYTQGYQS